MTQLPVRIGRTDSGRTDEPSGPVVRIQQMIFAEAAALDASDIHIEPGRSFTTVRYRVNGLLQHSTELPKWVHDSLTVRIKVLAKLDVSERRAPQDGHIDADSTGTDDARVSTVPSRWGEKVVIRMLKRARAAAPLAELGFAPQAAEKLQAWSRRSQGVLFVVGPTGSGKTTTLYALLDELRREPVNVVAIEDPIEYEVDGVTQIQINEKAGLTFARALRAILRQDPDVILVGEIRDADTARTAVHAAMTGHLVLTTVHATDSISAVSRLSELGVDPQSAAGVVLGVVAQRLLRLNCPECAEPDRPLPIYLRCLGIAPEDGPRLRRSPGCAACDFTGSRGRTGVFELLEMEGGVRAAFAGGDELALRRAAFEYGMDSLSRQAAALVLKGTVSIQEAYRSSYFGGVQ